MMKNNRGQEWIAGVIAIGFVLVLLVAGFVIFTIFFPDETKIQPKEYPKEVYDYTDYNISLSKSNISYERLYPNPLITKGSVLTTNKSMICVSGYSASVRNVPLSLRKKIFSNYGVQYPAPKGSVQLDHFINLAIGGSNNEDNLWIQPCPECKWKDQVENYLHRKVCEGFMTPEEAQRLITADWYKMYLRINGTSEILENVDED